MTAPTTTTCEVCSKIDPALPHTVNAERAGVSEATVRRHRKHYGQVQNAPEGGILVGASIRDALTGSWYKYAVDTDPSADYADFDSSALLNGLDRSSGKPESGSSTFVVSLNDWQIGKLEGGGSEATIARVHASVQAAKTRVAELRRIGRDLGELVIIGGGDILEGCTIYPNQSFNIDLHRHDQITHSVTLALWCIDQLAPLFDTVRMLVTKGNHGENRIDGKKTHSGDNDDTLIFKMAKAATDRDSALRHVGWTIADGHDEFVTYTTQTGWTLGTTHGDVFGKSPGPNAKKAWEWYKNMRAGRFDAGNVDVLVTHHFHHEEKADWGSCLWVQTRAQDGGSKHFESMSGQYSDPGMLSFVMTEGRRYQDEAYL